MKKTTVIQRKRPGPPPTGRGEPIVVRMHPPMLAILDGWISKQKETDLSRPEAIRRLVEIGLTVKTKVHQSKEGQKLRAREMAGNTIDDITDAKAHPDDQARRKRRLLKGPEEFRDVRVDRAKVKRK